MTLRRNTVDTEVPGEAAAVWAMLTEILIARWCLRAHLTAHLFLLSAFYPLPILPSLYFPLI
ncbi:hypothetical protein E2C01_049342 [Portunus trituberculatus]|uniref:Uncharacterized protein n=1 Tax=Portunus trituberculatus TaxID=210409 RepID=A0A5B7GDL8_PORTR|nr:hypothetical protein [Portunus trituberculatus]